MTDEQIIIKGLDVCSSRDRTCEDCPYGELIAPRCIRELTRDAYDLINQTKSEAIREFAERLKEKLNNFIDINQIYTQYECGYDDCLTAVQDLISDMSISDVKEIIHGE